MDSRKESSSIRIVGMFAGMGSGEFVSWNWRVISLKYVITARIDEGNGQNSRASITQPENNLIKVAVGHGFVMRLFYTRKFVSAKHVP